jgi:anti-sigma factor RsiW
LTTMTCRDLVELVTEYLEETLPAPERARFESHLAGCPHCRVYVQQMRLIVRALGRLPEEAVAPAKWDALREHFRHWARGY